MAIRDATPADAAAICGIAVRSDLFPAEEVAVVETMMADYFAGLDRRGHRCVLDEADEPIGVAYYEPAPATDRTWYLTMIGVTAEHQGRGRGTALLGHIEDDLRASRQRLLLVETSGADSFAATRRFYRHCGYTVEATVADYYEPGDDMVMFAKNLADKA